MYACCVTTTDTIDDLPDLETADCNHNLPQRPKKHQLLPADCTSSVSPHQKAKDSSLFPVSTDCNDDPDFDPRHQPATKKQAGQRRVKDPTAKSVAVKTKSEHSRTTTQKKKERTDGETKQPRKPRKAKDTANSQMKLQFVSERTAGDSSQFNDFFADDPFSFEAEGSPKKPVTTAYQYSRHQDRQTAGGGLPPLAERLGMKKEHEVPHETSRYFGKSSSTANVHPSVPVSLSSQRSSRLFDAMLKDQAPTVTRDHSKQPHGVTGPEQRCQPVDVAMNLESQPRYSRTC